MPRYVAKHPLEKRPELRRSPERDGQLEAWLEYELETAFSARYGQEATWRIGTRQYNCVPERPYRNTPVPNAPNIEIPLIAIASDSLTAQMTDTLYAGSPLLTARAEDDDWVEHAKAAQRWTNYIAANVLGLRNATDNAFPNCIRKGTAAYYIPFLEDIRKHASFEVKNRAPRIIPIPPQDILFLGGSRGQLQEDRWVALRFWFSPGEMKVREKRRGWDISKALPIAQMDWVRRQEEILGMTISTNSYRELYETFEIYAYYDYNDDGEDLDLLITYDRSSRKVLDVSFNPYDERPIEAMRYNLRPHLAYGMGVEEMLAPLQAEGSEIHCHRILNMLIANSRIWAALEGAVPENMEMWPNRVVPTRDLNAIKEMKMGDIYPSSMAAEVSVTSLAEQRVGTSGMIASSSQEPQNIGTRTPGITALSTLQAQNRRFTPPFDQMRLATAGAVRQSLLRYRERLLVRDTDVENQIAAVLGQEDAELVMELLKQPDFERFVQVDFTALSPQTNAESDRQSMLLLSNYLMDKYYRPAMEMITVASNPQAPPALIEGAKQISDRATELADRLLRTFENVRDPRRLLLDLSGVLDKAGEQVQNPLTGLMQALQGAQGQEQQANQGLPGGNGTPPQ